MSLHSGVVGWVHLSYSYRRCYDIKDQLPAVETKYKNDGGFSADPRIMHKTCTEVAGILNFINIV